jgi:CheY-like chemotaxis protein
MSMTKKPIILIVDDNNDFREIWKIKFTQENFDVIEAKNGEEALELLKSQKPDIILLDLLMPGMNGAETYLAIKNNAETKDLKVIFLTSMDKMDYESVTKNDQQTLKELLNIPYINKTKDLNEIVKMIKKELNIQ